MRGQIDAAFYIASAESPVIRALVKNRKLELMTFKRAEAYIRHYLYMSKVLLPRGIVNFEDDVPPNDKTLLAAAATLVIHDELHPALRTQLLRAMSEIHVPGGLFERPREFPSGKYLDFPLTDKAKRYIEDGPSLLDRYLPYWVADMIIRLAILLLPLVTLLIPLMRIVPRFSNVRHIVCASPAFLEEFGIPKTPEDLSRIPSLCYGNSRQPSTWSFTRPDGTKGRVTSQTRLVATSGDMLRAAAIAGIGMVCEPSFIIHKQIADGSLVGVLSDHAWFDMSIDAVYPPTRHLSARARAFIDFLIDRIGPVPGWEACLDGTHPPRNDTRHD